MKRLLILCIFILMTGGCITSGEYLALKNDVNQLKRDTYSQGRDIALMKKDFEALRDASKKSVGMESFEAIRESQEDINSALLSLQKELQTIRSRVEEDGHFFRKSLDEQASEMDILRGRLDRIDEELHRLNDEIAKLKLLGVEKAAEQTKDALKGKKKEMGAAGPQALYARAHEYLKNKEYGKAKAGFQQFLKKYPDHDLADNSQFWLAETYYREKDYENAIIEYQVLIKKYPRSPKIPSALFKQSASFEAIGDTRAGRVVLQLLMEKYPDSPEAKRARRKLGGTGSGKK